MWDPNKKDAFCGLWLHICRFFCAIGISLVVVLSGCSPRSSRQLHQTPQPSPRPSSPSSTPVPAPTPQVDDSHEGPGFSGGAGLFRPESPEEVIDAIYMVRKALKNPDLYSSLLSGAGLTPEPKDLRDQKLYELLARVLDPGNQYGNRVWETNNQTVANTIAEYIDGISLELKDSGPCSVEDNLHADASVSPMNRQGKICFSIEHLMGQSLYALEAIVAGLWLHELAHMNGLDEASADIVQELMEQSYHHLAQRYHSAESKLYRRHLQEAFKKLNEVSNDKKDISEIKEKIEIVRLMLTGFDSIKTCEFIDDNSHEVIRGLLDKAISNNNRIQFDKYRYALNINSDNFQELLEIKKTYLFMASDMMNCLPKKELVCQDQNHRKNFLNTLSSNAIQSFLMFFKQTLSLKSLHTFVIKKRKLNQQNTKEHFYEGFPSNILYGSLESQFYIKRTINQLISLKDFLKTELNCLKNRDETLRKIQLAKVEQTIEAISKVVEDSPFEKLLDKESRQVYINDFHQLEEDLLNKSGGLTNPQISDQFSESMEIQIYFMNSISKYREKYSDNKLINDLPESFEREMNIYKKAFESIRWLYFVSDLSEDLG